MQFTIYNLQLLLIRALIQNIVPWGGLEGPKAPSRPSLWWGCGGGEAAPAPPLKDALSMHGSVGQRQPCHDRGASARRRADLAVPAQLGGALAHRTQPNSGPPIVGKPAPIVANVQV